MQPNYLNILDVAPLLNKAVSSLRCDTTRAPESLPPFYKVGGRILFIEAEVHAFIKSKQVNHLSEPAKLKAGG